MKKVTILIIMILLTAVGYVSYIRLRPSQEKVNMQEATTTVVTMLDDPACDVSKYDSYLDVGFGVVQVTEGFLKKDMPIKATLSCDHKKLTITGSVNQVIIEPSAGYILSGGSNIPVLDEDYNFDGYNDISTMNSEGQGWTAIYSSYYFLYDPVQNKYVFNEMLSNMSNLYIKSTTTKTLYQYYGLGPDQGYNEITWKWKDHDLIKISDKVEKYDMQ